MTYLRRVPLLAAVLTTLGLASVASASAPAGVWSRVDQVTLDPNMKDPIVRIDGVFMVANQKPDFPDYPGYSVPQYGYMLYNCAIPKEQPMCLMQWDELKAIAGTEDNCRGWGDSAQLDNGSVRPAKDPELKPDAYPIAIGVTPGGTPCAALKAWQLENPPPDDPPDTTTGEPGSTGNVGSTGGDPGSTGTPETSGAPGSTSGEPGSTSGTPATTDAGSSGGTPGSDSDPATSAPTEGGAGSTGGGNNTTATATATDGAGADDKGGCACDSPAPGRPGLAALALLGLLGLRRRRRA